MEITENIWRELSPQTKKITIRIDEKTYNELQEISKKSNIKIGKVVKYMIYFILLNKKDLKDSKIPILKE